MSKSKRFVLTMAVLLIAFAFLWPTISWYALTPKEEQAIALGSREQIREYARRAAIKDLLELKALAAADAATAPGGAALAEKYPEVKRLSVKAYKENKRALPKAWTARALLGGFDSERTALDLVEADYRDRALKLKTRHGNAVKLGLDLSGGMSIVIQADLEALGRKIGHNLTAAEREDAMTRAVEVLNTRIDTFGLSEPVIRRQGEDQIYVEMPGAADPDRTNSIVMGRGRLAFHLRNDEATTALQSYLDKNPLGVDERTMTVADPSIVPAGYLIRKLYQKDAYGLDQFTGSYFVVAAEAGLDGTYIQSATVSSDSITGAPETIFQLSKEGGDIFYTLTEANVGKTLCVMLDDRVKSYANIQTAIRESVRITGLGQDEANNLAMLLRTAALPVELTVSTQQAIGASLGDDAIAQGKNAVIFGLAAVLLFMFAFYKGAGVNAVVAQALNLYIMLAVLSAFKLTLTLPSIAGFVLTVGMAVDASVVIFERIKEEMALGKSRRSAIEAGFDRAFWAVMDSNITTIIAALFLYQLGSGPIKGFAISLAIGNMTSLFTALFVSRLIFDYGSDVMKSERLSISWRTK